MQCFTLNNHKIYNLTAGKCIAEFLSDRAKRKLQKQDADIRRRIELIQDFEMPTVSSCIRLSRDGRYIMATGVYKPRVRCYDTSHMSMKFDRCMDSEVIKFEILSDDYTKIAFLQNDRFFEFHNQAGFFFRKRIPWYGRDLVCLRSKAELFFVGKSNEIIRYNLEKGMFMNSILTEAPEILCCEFNEYHEYLACGTSEGCLEMIDPRTRGRVSSIDCACCLLANRIEIDGVPSITSVRHCGALQLAVGTSFGQILLFDIRAKKPFVIKDHMCALPIKNIAFAQTDTNHDVILSADSRILKIWERETGKPYVAIEPGVKLNDICLVPNSGLLFMANEAQKILPYFIPDLGPAPSWCASLTGMTEQLEENPETQIYDNFKFVTRDELCKLNLNHLIGTEAVHAEMHGYFIKLELYQTMKAQLEPYVATSKKEKHLEKKRITVEKSLPNVNKKIAEKLMELETDDGSKKKVFRNILKDVRFEEMFNDEDFEVDEEMDQQPSGSRDRLMTERLNATSKEKFMETSKEKLTDRTQKLRLLNEKKPSTSSGLTLEERLRSGLEKVNVKEWTSQKKPEHDQKKTKQVN